MNAVYETLFEAAVLVVLVVSSSSCRCWRTALIPIVAIPVSLIGTFAVMAALGFSLNTLTLFGMVLAIGIVVDDAIVVVENVERNIALGLSPAGGRAHDHGRGRQRPHRHRARARAVFVPTAFIPGISGQFYRQFALTIAVSTLISAFNSLTLSPALAALLLKPHSHERPATRLPRFGNGPGERLQPRLRRDIRTAMPESVGVLVRHKLIVLPIYVGLLAGTVWIANHGAARLHPDPRPGLRDRRGPAAGRLLAVAHRRGRAAGLQDHAGDARRAGRGRLRGLLGRDLHQRLQRGRDLRRVPALRGAARRGIPRVQDHRPAVRPACRRSRRPSSSRSRRRRCAASAIPAASRSSCRSAPATTCDGVLAAAYQLMGQARQNPNLAGVFTTFSANSPQVYLEIDRQKARILNVPISNIFETLQVNLGTAYVNDFNAFGRV